MSFFVQIAADFFRQGGVHVASFEEERAELERLELIKRRREAQVSVRRKQLQDGLEDFFKELDQGTPQKRIDDVLKSFIAQVQGFDKIADPNRHATEMLNVEFRARREVRRIREELHLTRPRGVGLSRDTRRSWDAYRAEILKLDEACFHPAEQEIDDTVQRHALKAKLVIDQRRRLESALNENVRDARQRTRRESNETQQAGKGVSDRVVELTRQVMTGVEGTISQVLADVARLDLTNRKESDLVEMRAGFEEKVDQATVKALDLLSSARDQLRAMSWSRESNENIVTQLDIIEATESELLDARERADLDLEMTQLGAAIEVINHEFDASIRTVRASLRRLRAWADMNPSLRELHEDIRTSFEHLDGYLTLFTPLQRRLYRQEVEILGSAIVRFLSDLFRERLRRHEVELESTARFNQHTILGYPSTFYPVFVNLIDNSLFWLSDQERPRKVILDVSRRRDGDIGLGPGNTGTRPGLYI